MISSAVSQNANQLATATPAANQSTANPRLNVNVNQKPGNQNINHLSVITSPNQASSTGNKQTLQHINLRPTTLNLANVDGNQFNRNVNASAQTSQAIHAGGVNASSAPLAGNIATVRTAADQTVHHLSIGNNSNSGQSVQLSGVRESLQATPTSHVLSAAQAAQQHPQLRPGTRRVFGVHWWTVFTRKKNKTKKEHCNIIWCTCRR